MPKANSAPILSKAVSPYPQVKPGATGKPKLPPFVAIKKASPIDLFFFAPTADANKKGFDTLAGQKRRLKGLT